MKFQSVASWAPVLILFIQAFYVCRERLSTQNTDLQICYSSLRLHTDEVLVEVSAASVNKDDLEFLWGTFIVQKEVVMVDDDESDCLWKIWATGGVAVHRGGTTNPQGQRSTDTNICDNGNIRGLETSQFQRDGKVLDLHAIRVGSL